MPDLTVWTIPANGADSVSEEYGYLTDIITAWDGSEQRMALRSIPLRVIEFAFLASDGEAQLAQNLLHSIQDRVAVIPQWQLGSPLLSAVSPGASLLPTVDAVAVGFRAGQFALVHKSATEWELFTVVGTSGSGVTTSDTAGLAWPAGTMVYPAWHARLQDKIGVRWHSSAVLEGSLRWTLEQT